MAARPDFIRSRTPAPAAAAARLRGAPVTFLLDHVAAEMVERLSAGEALLRACRRYRHADGRGCANLMRERKVARGRVIGVDAAGGRHGVAADEEALPFADGSLDLAVSALALQWVNDLPGTLAQIRRALKPDGLFLAALARRRYADRIAAVLRRGGSGNRRRHVAARRAVRGCARARRAAAARGPRAAGRRCRSADGALRVAVRSDARSARHGRDQCADRAAARTAEARDVAADGGNLCANASPIRTAALRATFDIVWLSGWAPHESQQQPLQAGLGESAPCRRASHHRECRPARKPATRSAVSADRVLDGRRTCVEHRHAERIDGGDDRNGDAGGDHGVFDRGRAALVADQAAKSLESEFAAFASSAHPCRASQQCRQMGDERRIGRRHRIIPKLVRPAPRRAACDALRVTVSLPAPADIERHQKVEIRIGVARKGQGRKTGFLDDDSQFLQQFPYQRLLRASRPPRPCRREIPTAPPSPCRVDAPRSARGRRHR